MKSLALYKKNPSTIKKAILKFDSQLKETKDPDAIQDEAVRRMLKKMAKNNEIKFQNRARTALVEYWI